MKRFRVNLFVNTFAVLLLLGFGYYFRENIGTVFNRLLNKFQPCEAPITYSIASLDSRFGLSKTELLNNMAQAEKIWEASVNRNLFEYSPTGEIKINFIYDYRQKATDAMKKIGIVIGDNRTTYDELKIKYDSLVVSYNKQKLQLDTLIAAYKADKNAFEKDVNHWNSRGGAPKAEYEILEQRKTDLNNQVVVINQTRDSFNELVETINSTGIILNKLIASLNIKVGEYNTVGASAGKEFKEGEYVRDANGTAINIFQFNDKNQLMRVFAHEFGHALGLDHIDNPEAIMYYLNESGNEKLTTDDLAALKNICAIK